MIKNGWQVVHVITHIFVRNEMEMCLRDLLEMQELTDIISCVPLMNMEKSINNILMMAAAVGVFHYHKTQQQKHWFRLVQP